MTGDLLFACILGRQIHTAARIQVLNLVGLDFFAGFTADSRHKNLTGHGRNPSHTIHGTGISTYIWLIVMINVGKYTYRTLDGMGYDICICNSILCFDNLT